MSEFCDTFWREFAIYPNFILPALYGISTLLTGPAIFLYIKAFINGNLQHSPKPLFFTALILFLAIFVYFLCETLLYSIECRLPDESRVHHGRTNRASYVLYQVQALLVMMNLFMRLIYIFKDTAFRLSKCSIVSFWCLLILASILFTSALIVGWTTRYDLFTDILFLLAGVIYISVVIWLNVLFIQRVVVVHKAEQRTDVVGSNDELMHIATKTSLLCLLSTITTICSVLSFTVVDTLASLQSPHFYFLRLIGALFDIWFNFLSVLLTFQLFESVYMRLFGCCHAACSSCVTRCVQSTKDEKAMKQIQEMSTSSI